MLALHPGAFRNEGRCDDIAGIAPFAQGAVDHVSRTARFVTGADLGVAGHAVDPLLQRREVVRQPLEPRRRLRTGRENRDRDRLLVHIRPSWMIGRTAGAEVRTGTAVTAATDDMGWSPQNATCGIVAGGSGDSGSTREELTHAKVGGQPSHTF
jgi:hypothetical protein